MTKFKTLLFIIIYCFIFNICYSQTDTITNFKVIRVIDGDTFVIDIDNLPDIFGKNISVRIKGIDTPELNSRDAETKNKAIQAKNELERLLKNAKKITLYNIGRDKYFRILASVKADNIDIAEHMIKKGFAVKYEGGKKNSVYGLKYEDIINELDKNYYMFMLGFSEYNKIFIAAIFMPDILQSEVIPMIMQALGGFDIKLITKNKDIQLNSKAYIRQISKYGVNSTYIPLFYISIFDFDYLLNDLYDFLKNNTITAIQISGDDYNETVDIKHYKDFQKNLISMIENLKKVDELIY